jgi:large subunit ribosomal protein L6
MSRIGKKQIIIPAGTEVSVQGGAVTVKGKAGVITRPIHPSVAIAVEGNEVKVAPADRTRLGRALWGTYAAHVRNMIAGASTPFEKKLQIEGIGFKAAISGNAIDLNLGFSHPVKVEIPEGVAAKIEKNIITLTGVDKDVVGQFAASIRSLKKPEPYKGKGIRYVGEVIRMKQGKKAGS